MVADTVTGRARGRATAPTPPRRDAARSRRGCRSPGPRRCRSRTRPRGPAGPPPRAGWRPLAPAHCGSEVPKLLPRSPRPAAENSASQHACAATSPSEWPARPRGSSGKCRPARCSGTPSAQRVHVGADAGARGGGRLTGPIMPYRRAAPRRPGEGADVTGRHACRPRCSGATWRCGGGRTPPLARPRGRRDRPRRGRRQPHPDRLLNARATPVQVVAEVVIAKTPGPVAEFLIGWSAATTSRSWSPAITVAILALGALAGRAHARGRWSCGTWCSGRWAASPWPRR